MVGTLEEDMAVDITSVSLAGTAEDIDWIGVIVGYRDGRALWHVVGASVGRLLGDGVIVGDVSTEADLGGLLGDMVGHLIEE